MKENKLENDIYFDGVNIIINTNSVPKRVKMTIGELLE